MWLKPFEVTSCSRIRTHRPKFEHHSFFATPMAMTRVRQILLVSFQEEARDHKLLSDMFEVWSSCCRPSAFERADATFPDSLHRDLELGFPTLQKHLLREAVHIESDGGDYRTNREAVADAANDVEANDGQLQDMPACPEPASCCLKRELFDVVSGQAKRQSILVGSRAYVAVVLGSVYAQVCTKASYREHVENSERCRRTCPRHAAFVKVKPGRAPVPKGMWRGTCASVQRALLRHFRALGSGPRLRARRKKMSVGKKVEKGPASVIAFAGGGGIEEIDYEVAMEGSAVEENAVGAGQSPTCKFLLTGGMLHSGSLA